MIRIFLFAALTIVAGVSALPATAPNPTRPHTDNNFDPYIKCKFDDHLTQTDLTRFPADHPRYREIDTLGGKKRISVADGYSLDLAYPKTDVFVDVKVELSQPEAFEQDKKTVLDDLSWSYSSARLVKDKELRQVSLNGYQLFGNDRDVIGSGIVIGTYVFFENTKHHVITMYFLNQRPDKRKAKTIEEYVVLRDHFLDQFTRCAAATP